jgi:RND family efflux transporter MFP subunit
LPAPAIPKIENAADLSGNSAGNAKDDQYRGTGTLHARDEAELGPKASGVLTAITVDEGDRVKKGQLLFRLDSQQAGLSIKQSEAALGAANVSLSAARLDEGRTRQLLERGSVAPAVYDAAKSRLDAALAGVEQAKAALAVAKQMAGELGVYSPINGIVTAKLKSVGETVTMVPPTVVLVVQDLSALELRARLPERVLSEVAVDKPVEVSFPALAETRTVKITRVTPTIDPRTRTVEVIVNIDNSDGKLKSGMLAEIRLLDGAHDAPTASSAAALGAPSRAKKKP